MSYLEEWDRIEQMIENHNTSKATVITSEKRHALALSHIAKCLSVLADDIVGDWKECKEVTNDPECWKCNHYNDEDESACLTCKNGSKFTPFGLRRT